MSDPPARRESTDEPAAAPRARRADPSPREARARRRAGILALAWGLAIPLAWAGCTVTANNYRTLSFLFDGVPDPSAVPGAPGEPGAIPTFVVVHAPFAEERCEECHSGRARPTRHDSSACVRCHAQTASQHPRMHGPVAALACLWCHNPHESTHRHLLRDTDRNVCAQCHTPALLSPERVPAHADTARACLECHAGHGGDTPFFLRPGAELPPAPPPAPTGSAGAN
ncbi:MAG: cytochrome c3 family protein [Phycisphaerales bacterium]